MIGRSLSMIGGRSAGGRAPVLEPASRPPPPLPSARERAAAAQMLCRAGAPARRGLRGCSARRPAPLDSQRDVVVLETDQRLDYAHERLNRHRTMVVFDHVKPVGPYAARRTFVAPDATLAGNVELWAFSSVWYGAVVLAHRKLVRIGCYSSIQDNAVVSETLRELSPQHDGSAIIGHYTTIGPGALLTACTIHDRVIVGARCVVHPDATVESEAVLAPGSVLPAGARVPRRQLWAGNPARFVADLGDRVDAIDRAAKDAWGLANQHQDEFYLPIGTNYIEAQHIDPTIGYRVYASVDPAVIAAEARQAAARRGATAPPPA